MSDEQFSGLGRQGSPISYLNQRHAALRNAYESVDSEQKDQIVVRIRNFMAEAAQSGRRISDENERYRAQVILDYWSAELIETDDPSDSLSFAVLDSYQIPPNDAENGVPSTDNSRWSQNETSSLHVGLSKQHVRFAAAARLWRSSNCNSAYLLSGDALTHAQLFSHFDKDIAEFVKASEQAQHTRKSRLWRFAAIGGVVFSIIGLYEPAKDLYLKVYDPDYMGVVSAPFAKHQLKLADRNADCFFDMNRRKTELEYGYAISYGICANGNVYIVVYPPNKPAYSRWIEPNREKSDGK